MTSIIPGTTPESQRDQLHARIEHDFNLHRPDSTTALHMDRVRAWYIALAHDLVETCPPGRDLSMALTDLETSQRCAIAALAKAVPA